MLFPNDLTHRNTKCITLKVIKRPRARAFNVMKNSKLLWLYDPQAVELGCEAECPLFSPDA